jgi:hypothetical protein
MRYPYQAEPDLQITPIEKIRLPLRSRDELPPILAGLQWLWMHPTLRAEILALLEAAVLAGKAATGRTGMDLWQILVLGVVRLGLDADWDRLEHIANYDSLVRQMLGVPATPWGEETKVFGHQTLRDNVALLDEELLQQINARIAAAGREVFAKKDGAPLAALEVKVDTYVLETDVHFPTDLNLLWDAGRKCVDLIEKYRRQFGYALPGWRKAKAWRRQLKSCERIASQIVYRGGPNNRAPALPVPQKSGQVWVRTLPHIRMCKSPANHGEIHRSMSGVLDSLPGFGAFFLSLNTPTRLALAISAAGPSRVSLVPGCFCGACHALRPRQTFQSLTG